MALKTLLELVFGKTRRSKHIRSKAEQLLYALRDKKYLSVREAKELVGGKKTYFKIMRKLRSIGLIALTKDIEGEFSYSLTLDAYKFFVKKHLIEEIEQVLKNAS